MFRLLGAAVRYLWPGFLIAWVAAFALLHETAPAWNKVAQDREFGFLPDDAPTREGQALFKKAFPDDKQASNVVIVVNRNDATLTEADRIFLRDVVAPALHRLADQEKEPLIAAIRTPADAGSGVLLLSDDRHAALVVVELTTELLEQRNWPLLAEIEGLISSWRTHAKMPDGLNLDLTGSAIVGRDMTRGQQQSAQAIESWTIIIATAILLLIYRAPLLALIPLASVFMATQIAMMVLAHLAETNAITLFEGIEIYITVILYGTGIDYCLFLIARYQEEREGGADWGDALTATVGHVGPALAASAATVIFGIGMMTFATFGKFHHAGIAVGLSLAISLCVVMTFATSLLRLFGRWAFWPRNLSASAKTPATEGDARPGWLRRHLAAWFSWDALGNLLTRRPALIWLCSVLAMSPLAIGGILYADNVDYDFIARLPADAPSVPGARALQKHFPAGIAGAVTVLIYDPDLDFLIEDGKGQIELSALTHRIAERKTELRLADVRGWSRPLGTGWAARQATGAPLAELERGRAAALHYYIADAGAFKGQVTRLELTMLQNPLSRKGIATLNQIETAIRDELYGDLTRAKIYFLGPTADMRDLRRVTGNDQIRIEVLVLACVLTILTVLLRRPGVCVYLIASVLFSYFVTLGAAQALFWWLNPAGFAGLDWKVPVFLFVILVAIGEDYNIFLMTRVAEEQTVHGPIDGVRVALVRTGRIITGCGIIMMGTFGSLLSSSMEDLQQLGFALAFGVFVDTFVVRPILVPTFLILLERGRGIWRELSNIPDRDLEQPSAD